MDEDIRKGAPELFVCFIHENAHVRKPRGAGLLDMSSFSFISECSS